MRSPPRLLAPLEQLYREADWVARSRSSTRSAILSATGSGRPRDRRALRRVHGLRARRPVRSLGGVGAGAHGGFARALRAGLRSRQARARVRRVPLSLQSRARRRRLLRGGAAHPGPITGRLRAFFAAGFSPGRSRRRARARAVRGRLPRSGPVRGVPSQPALLRVSPLVSRARPPAAPASDCTSTCAGWCGASRRTSASGSRSRRRRSSCPWTRTSRTWRARSASRGGAPGTGRWPRRSRRGSGPSIPRIP